jgi:signal transduction histidine kinase
VKSERRVASSPPGSSPSRTVSPLSPQGFFAARLRLRLALVITAAVIVTAGVLGTGSYFIVKQGYEARVRDDAVTQTQSARALAQRALPANPSASDYDAVVNAPELRGAQGVLLQAPGLETQSGNVQENLITPDLSQTVESGTIALGRLRILGNPVLVAGVRVSPGTNLYLFFSLADLQANLGRLSAVLFAGGFLLAVLGTVAGWFLARRTLRPVSATSAAAHMIAGGNLSVRLREGPDELGMMGTSFNRMATSLEELIQGMKEARGREQRFVADVAHELRTPVGALSSEIELLNNSLFAAGPDVLPGNAKRYAQLAGRDTDKLCSLVADLLEMSRLDTPTQDLREEEFDLMDFLGRVANAHRWPPFVSFATRAPSDAEPIALRTDPRHLERVVVNLVENALRHGGPPVRIRARVAPIGLTPPDEGRRGCMVLRVVDDGPGIAPEHLPHVFERFYKADPSRSASGSGLGLSIAAQSARLLGGTVSVRSRPGRTCFSLRLPLDLPPASPR